VIIEDADPVLIRLSRLPVLTPDARRAARRRARCRAGLRPARRPHRTLGLALFASLCVLYLAAIALDILRVRGVF
jgi:hypothetical protein